MIALEARRQHAECRICGRFIERSECFNGGEPAIYLWKSIWIIVDIKSEHSVS